jgi:putative transposase
MGFIDAMRAEGHAVESICQVLREQGCPVATRTYRSWKQPDRRVADRTITDATVINTIRGLAWRADPNSGEPKLTAGGPVWVAEDDRPLRRTTMPEVSADAVDRGMRTLGLAGVRRDKGTRTTIPAKDGIRADDLLDRDFIAEAPNNPQIPLDQTLRDPIRDQPADQRPILH